MSFNRLSYDKSATQCQYEESVGPGLYQTNTPILCSTCFQDNPQIINQHGGVSMDSTTEWRFYDGPVDVESDLRNINRPLTRCGSSKYQPRCPNCGTVTSGQPCGDGVSISCHNCSQKIPRGGRCEDVN